MQIVFLHACASLARSFAEGSRGKQPPGEATGPLDPVKSRTRGVGASEAFGYRRQVSAMTSRARAAVVVARPAADVCVPHAVPRA